MPLSTDDDILILDPESEFGFLTEALGGEVIRVSASSDTHINALDMDKAYGDERNPLIEKSEFILSLFEQLVGAGGVSAKEKSILDRCTYDVYREYMANNYQGEVPTLKDLYYTPLETAGAGGQGLALSSELSSPAASTPCPAHQCGYQRRESSPTISGNLGSSSCPSGCWSRWTPSSTG